jgi:hydroxymethylbilane synthase
VIQTQEVVASLKGIFPQLQFQIRKIKTTADIKRDLPFDKFNSPDIFTRQIQNALLAGEIDFAVHSLKDMPTDIPEGLLIAAVPKRKTPFDALIAKAGQLPAGARVGTSSLRRKAQLLSWRKDLRIVPLRGNLDTRIKKLQCQSELDAIVAAQAALERLGFRGKYETLSSDSMLPCPGQGALAIEVRQADKEIIELVSRINDPDSFLAVQAERRLLGFLGTGCRIPVAALAQIKGEQIELKAAVFASDGSRMVRSALEGSRQEATALADKLAEVLLSHGAEKLLTNADRRR